MKKHTFTLALLLVALLPEISGCKTAPTVGPSLLRTGVSTAVAIGIVQNPDAAPALRRARDYVCAAQGSTAKTPTEFADGLARLGDYSPTEELIISLSLSLYSVAISALPPAKWSPYGQALCDGLRLGAPDRMTFPQLRRTP